MSDLGEAAAGVGVMFIAGVFMLRLSDQLTVSGPFDFQTWGIIYLVAGVVLGTVLVGAAVRSVIP